MVEAKLRVSIDLSAVPANAVGVGQYLRSLTSELANLKSASDLQITGIARKDDSYEWAVPTIKVVPAGSRPLRLAWEQTGLVRLLRSNSVALHHAPHYTMPIAAKKLAEVPVVVTIHDCTFFDHPQWHEKSKAVFFQNAIRFAARNADALIAVSAYTADRLTTIASPRCPVHIIPHGVDLQRFKPREDQTEQEASSDDQYLSDLKVDGRYFLFVGTLEPRKGVPGLIRAFDRVAQRNDDVKLVLVGQRGWGTGELDRALFTSQYSNRILELGYVPDEAVSALMRGATSVVYPSLEEGYGMPALEAMACGVRLITSTGSALEEVASGVGTLVEPGDEPGLVDAMDVALNTDANMMLRNEGIVRASNANWKSSADAHAQVYRTLS